MKGARAGCTLQSAVLCTCCSSFSFHCLPCDFLDRRDAVDHLLQTAAPQRDHAFVDRLATELQRRRPDQNQFAEFVGHFHHFVQSDATLVTGVAALLATAALLWYYPLCFLRGETGLDQRGGRVRMIPDAAR